MRGQQSIERRVISRVNAQGIAKRVQSIFERATGHQDLAGFGETSSALFPKTEVEVTVRELRANLCIMWIEISNSAKYLKRALRGAGAIVRFNDCEIMRA